MGCTDLEGPPPNFSVGFSSGGPKTRAQTSGPLAPLLPPVKLAPHEPTCLLVLGWHCLSGETLHPRETGSRHTASSLQAGLSVTLCRMAEFRVVRPFRDGSTHEPEAAGRCVKGSALLEMS